MRSKQSILLFLLLPVLLVAQTGLEDRLSKNFARLEQLKKQIAELQKQISASRLKERSELEQLELIDREMALVARAKGVLKQQADLLSQRIHKTNQKLATTVKRLNQLKDLYAKRAVYAYKYGKIRNLELLLSSESFNQALIRYRYLKIIAEHDARTIKAIEKKKEEIKRIRARLADQLAQKQRNIREKEEQERQYVIRKKEKNALLQKLRRQQNIYRQRLAQKQKEKEKMLALIAELERERALRKKKKEPATRIPHFSFKDFRKAKGKLPWPVRGKIVTHYGKQRDPQSKTYIKNTDIEIKSKLGTPVQCVFKGVVRIITYLPGYGNTIIVDHGKGYYTVYSHLDEIYVEKGEAVSAGQIIATVGDSGSLEGAKLQFGIYGGKKTYNPEKWLSRK
ncbi:MAG TPA: hypothetical protein ENJ89_08695 [Caldithrix abyssi]|uniref:Peptidase M23 domain-containing protein n=1 Tax=Caldithrix abyssi TaxID=187145 RepID=A0A7V5PR81_CALAY|nr:hypothetical protein [Caldithrix abyssi]